MWPSCFIRSPLCTGAELHTFPDNKLCVILQVSRNVREIVKLAMSQAQKRSRLSEYTTFNRINSSNGDLDPFDGESCFSILYPPSSLFPICMF